MEGGGDEDGFEDYEETTVFIGRVGPLVIAGLVSLLLFVPVFILSIRPSEKRDDNGDEDDDDDDENASIIKTLWAKKLDKGESAPLLSKSKPEDETAYGGTFDLEEKPRKRRHSTSPIKRNRSDSKINARFSVPKWPSSVAFHRLGISDSTQRKSVHVDIDPTTMKKTPNGSRSPSFFDDDEEDKEGHCNAVKFSDPKTSAFEKLKIVTCHNCDAQTKSMLSLGVPYLSQALASAASEMIQVAIIGHQLGTSELSAYIIIDLFIKLTSDAVGGIITSGNTMISQIAEAESESSSRKIGSYLQLSIIFYVIGMVPILVFWSFCMEDILLYLKLEPDMAEEGQQFAIPYTLSIIVGGIAAGFQYLLDVVGFEVQSTIVTFIGEVGTTVVVAVVMCCHNLFPDMTLVDLGYLYLCVNLCYLGGMLAAIYFNGWIEEYYEGLRSSPFSIFKTSTENNEGGANAAAMKLMLYNAGQFAFSNFLYQGEWQILLFFASSLGPAEVAAWGLLGFIWEELEYIVAAVAEGCEVRVAISLGTGDFKTAKLIAYKALWISFVWGTLVTILFLLFEEEIPKLITTDPFLQQMISFNLPMICIANIVSGIAIMGEHILWCQNRVPMATAIASGSSAFVTLPLAALSSYVYHFNLIGQTAGVAIGAAAFAAMALYAIISSDWKQISEDVISLHGHSSSSSESSSCSSDGDDEKEEHNLSVLTF